MPETIARIASIALALAFGWAGVAKLLAYERWTTVLDGYGLPRSIKTFASPAVPLLELAISMTLILGAARAGGIAALIALVPFSAAIARARSVNGDRLPCGCFGGSEHRHYKTMLARNAALGVVAVMVISGGDIGPVWSSAPSSDQLLPAALVFAGTALILWVAWQASISLRRREHP
jgi:hypothetical protein